MSFTISGTNGLTFPSGTTEGDAAVGYGQTWASYTGSRAVNTTYTNSTTKPIMVIVVFSAINNLTLVINGVTVIPVGGINAYAPTTFIVPAGQTYAINAGSATLMGWSELR